MNQTLNSKIHTHLKGPQILEDCLILPSLLSPNSNFQNDISASLKIFLPNKRLTISKNSHSSPRHSLTPAPSKVKKSFLSRKKHKSPQLKSYKISPEKSSVPSVTYLYETPYKALYGSQKSCFPKISLSSGNHKGKFN
ncbi:unnamed protein product [Blepharisma stoltei]|uniref:Uncharacterized protein n=1 Tax=Blepharisma stoltei TaxID=1481888 RepID=A0AAU9K5G4_9CILI|nr:unnamed protein product [Blepharisma stoltei]